MAAEQQSNVETHEKRTAERMALVVQEIKDLLSGKWGQHLAHALMLKSNPPGIKSSALTLTVHEITRERLLGIIPVEKKRTIIEINVYDIMNARPSIACFAAQRIKANEQLRRQMEKDLQRIAERIDGGSGGVTGLAFF